VEGLSPDSVAVIDMDGNLLSRPKRASSGDSQVTTEALEVRQQIEHDMVAKINATLEPLLGADQFRAGASVECDLTSGEQDEETYNPDQSVMVTSQKSEDSNDRGVPAGGIPGTAANLPHPAGSTGIGGGTSHRTENVTYQTSRIVRHTRIPEGVVRKMSLSVLVGQPYKWEGTGKNRHQILVPPSADTLKTIRDLVAGVTGFDATRGDQLIVETLPFETNTMLDTTPLSAVPATKPDSEPPWLQAVNKYRNLIFTAVGGLMFLGILIKMVLRYMPGRGAKSARPVERVDDDLEAARRQMAAQQSGGAVNPPAQARQDLAPGESRMLLAEMNAETAERVRQLAQEEPAVSANVIRMWLHNQKA
jgi:flagellar M-ring protein FliF